jgi:maltooligosyltrehalose trehalohydrolase
VELVSGEARHPLGRRPEKPDRSSGLWRLGAPLPPGTRYQIALDGGPPLPDPRSRSQPDGVHGASEIIAPDFAWADAEFSAAGIENAVIYELHLGTFSREGTFASALERLPHLVELGVTHVEIMPVHQFPGACGWGYDGVDLFAPHRAYGTPGELKRLVNTCHARGLAVLLDVVYNHFGPDGNYLTQFAPYFSDAHHTPWGQAVNLDGPYSDEVRSFFCDNALMWLEEYHFDGLRLDAVHALFDHSALHFLEQLAIEVEALGRRRARKLVLIAESDRNDPRLVFPRDRGGYGLDGVWADDLHHALHTVLTGERKGYYGDYGSMQALGRCLEQGYYYQGDYSPSRRRRHGRPPGGAPLFRFVGCLQNHDQVGNRAQGERIAHLTSIERARVGAFLLLTSALTPLLFQGEEWSATSPFLYFTDHQDPSLAKAVSDGRRREFSQFGWDPSAIPDPQERATFLRSKLDWSELEREPHRTTLRLYRDLIGLRRRLPELRSRPARVDHDENAATLHVQREKSAIYANLGQAPARFALPDTARLLVETGKVTLEAAELVLEPDSAALVVFERVAGAP